MTDMMLFLILLAILFLVFIILNIPAIVLYKKDSKSDDNVVNFFVLFLCGIIGPIGACLSNYIFDTIPKRKGKIQKVLIIIVPVILSIALYLLPQVLLKIFNVFMGDFLPAPAIVINIICKLSGEETFRINPIGGFAKLMIIFNNIGFISILYCRSVQQFKLKKKIPLKIMMAIMLLGGAPGAFYSAMTFNYKYRVEKDSDAYNKIEKYTFGFGMYVVAIIHFIIIVYSIVKNVILFLQQ